jgi:hypothetical protein
MMFLARGSLPPLPGNDGYKVDFHLINLLIEGDDQLVHQIYWLHLIVKSFLQFFDAINVPFLEILVHSNLLGLIIISWPIIDYLIP